MGGCCVVIMEMTEISNLEARRKEIQALNARMTHTGTAGRDNFTFFLFLSLSLRSFSVVI